MVSRHKEQEKALKAPDQFQVQVMTGMDWVVKHLKTIALVVAPLLAVAIGYLVYEKVKLSGRDARLEELGKIQISYQAEERKVFDERQGLQKQVEAIDGKLAATPPPQPEEAAKLNADKAALEGRMEALRPDHSASAQQFQAYFEKHQTTPEGWMAGVTAARQLLDTQKVAEATPILETIVKNSSSHSFYQTQTRFLLSSAYEEQGDYDKALAELDQLDKIVADDLKPRVMLARGRVQMLKDQKSEAKATFDKLIESHGASPEAQKARSFQALLNG